MEPALAEAIYELDRCIECGCCIAGCGTAQDAPRFRRRRRRLGKIARFRLDPRDTRSDDDTSMNSSATTPACSAA